MYTLTEEDVRFLDSISDKIRTAMKSDYARNMTSTQIERLRNLYRKMYGQDYVGSSSCSTCQLRLLKKVGEWLEKRKVREEPEQALTVNELEKTDTNTNTDTTIKTKKGTRRKKK